MEFSGAHWSQALHTLNVIHRFIPALMPAGAVLQVKGTRSWEVESLAGPWGLTEDKLPSIGTLVNVLFKVRFSSLSSGNHTADGLTKYSICS